MAEKIIIIESPPKSHFIVFELKIRTIEK